MSPWQRICFPLKQRPLGNIHFRTFYLLHPILLRTVGSMLKKKLFKTHFDNNLNQNLDRTSFIRDRIKIVEKYFPELGKAVYDYIDKNAKSRDCIDKIAMILSNYGKTENVTSCFKLRMNDFANILFDVGTEKDAQVQTMETKVLDHLSEYNKLCALVQMELKVSLIANERERNWLKQSQRVKKTQPQNLERISLIEAEILRARGEAVRSSKNLNDCIDTFERSRMVALKESLLTWTLAELQFHTKALQFFTNAYHIVADMDVSSDIEEFRNKLKSTEDIHGSDSGIRLDSVFQLMSSPFHSNMQSTRSGIPHVCSSLNSPQSSFLSNSLYEE